MIPKRLHRKNSAEGLGRTYGVLSEIIYKLTVNEEQFEVIDTMMSNLDKFGLYNSP